TLNFQLDLPLAAVAALFLYVLLRTGEFASIPWSVAAGVVGAVGLLTKPPFAVFALPPALMLAWPALRRRRPGPLLAAAAVALALCLPWYGLRVFGLPAQILNRSFRQAAEQGSPPVWTPAGFLAYPRSFASQLGALAVLLLLGGLYRAARRHPFLLVACLVPFGALLVIQNKNPRYTLPLLPVASLIAAEAVAALAPRAGQALAALVLVTGGLQVAATTFGAGPLAGRAPFGIELAHADPPAPAAWPQRALLARVAADSGGRPVTVGVIPNCAEVAVGSFRYYAARAGAAALLPEFVADGRELRVGLDWAAAGLARGWIRRVTVSAASARVGELRRPGAPTLRLEDVRVVLEGLTVNPARVAATGRLEPLALERFRIERLTLSQGDLQAFLAAGRRTRRVRVRFLPGQAAVRMGAPGSAVDARVSLGPGRDGRPVVLDVHAVRIGGVPVRPVHGRAGQRGDRGPLPEVPDGPRLRRGRPGGLRARDPVDGLLPGQDALGAGDGAGARRAARRRGAAHAGGADGAVGRRAQDGQRRPRQRLRRASRRRRHARVPGRPAPGAREVRRPRRDPRPAEPRAPPDEVDADHPPPAGSRAPDLPGPDARLPDLPPACPLPLARQAARGPPVERRCAAGESPRGRPPPGARQVR